MVCDTLKCVQIQNRTRRVVVMTESNATTNQRAIQVFAQRNNLSADDAERILLDVHRWDDLPENYMEGEERKWSGLLESLRIQ